METIKTIPTRMCPLGALASAPYREVEYLTGTGTQWIDTGVAAFDWPYLEILCKVNKSYSSPHRNVIIGVSNASSRWQGIAPYDTASTHEIRYRGYDSTASILVSAMDDFILLVFDGPNRMAYAGNLSTALLSGKATGLSYGVWTYINNVDPIEMSVRYVKIGKSASNLLFDAIPVIDKLGVACMFDKVSKTFFYNAGTGRFYTNLNPPPSA